MVKIIEKRKIIIHLDKGIIGTLVKKDDISSESGYSNIYYLPLQKGWFSKGKEAVLRNVPSDCIHSVMSGSTAPGVEKEMMLIYTDEQDSVIKRIFNNNLQKRIEEYKDTIESLKKQVASLRQEANDARSGVNKSIAGLKDLNRAGRPETTILPPQRPYNQFNTDLDGDY